MKPGDRVRMTELAKLEMYDSSPEHVDEFGDCVGTVIGPAQEGYPELDVRWWPAGVKFAYRPEELELV